MDYSRAPCLGADQKTRGLWERDWYRHCCSSITFSWVLCALLIWNCGHVILRLMVGWCVFVCVGFWLPCWCKSFLGEMYGSHYFSCWSVWWSYQATRLFNLLRACSGNLTGVLSKFSPGEQLIFRGEQNLMSWTSLWEQLPFRWSHHPSRQNYPHRTPSQSISLPCTSRARWKLWSKQFEVIYQILAIRFLFSIQSNCQKSFQLLKTPYWTLLETRLFQMR